MRNLIPHFFISTRPLGWKCSSCGQQFLLIDVPAQLPDLVPVTLRMEFLGHDCDRYRESLRPTLFPSLGEAD